MKTAAQKFRIAPTASMVLSLARDAYPDGASKIYFDNIDHSEGQALASAAISSYAHSMAVAELRKRYVRKLLSRFAVRTPQFRVCIPGAGLDPLSLYLLERYPERISHILEIDRAFMEEKRDMYARLQLDTSKVHFLTSDITEVASWQQELNLLSSATAQPTVVLMEGLIYYLSRDKFTGMLEALRTPQHNNYMIIEYGIPYEDIPESDREGCRNVVRAIEQGTGWPVQLYHRSDLASLVAFMGARDYAVRSLHDIERELNGSNRIFREQGAGLIEIMDFYL